MSTDAPIIAQLEQDVTHLKNLATEVLGPFHDSLIEAGFTDKEALRLVRDYFEDVLWRMHREDDDG